MRDLEEIKAQIKGVEGWLSDREAVALYSEAKLCVGRGVIVEIGSWKGKSTIALALGSQDGNGVPVFAIDPHNCVYDEAGSLMQQPDQTTFGVFQSNIRKAGVERIVTPVVSSSGEAAKQWHRPIELLWIDGDHAYDAVRQDLEEWTPYLVEDGKVMLHDSTESGVRQAVMAHIFRSPFFKNVGVLDKVTYATRSGAPVSILERIRNQYLHTVYWLSGFMGELPMPLKVRETLKGPVKRIFTFLRER